MRGMASKGIWRASGVALDVIGAGFTLWWAAMLICPGLALLCIDDDQARMGGITLIVSGVFVLVKDYIIDLFIWMFGRAADASKGRIAPRPADQDGDGELTFDADAALMRYFAQRSGADAGPPAAPESVRPVFGRRAPPE
jgi:hypothetical protein